MSFISLTFAVFFVLLLAAYYLVPKKVQWVVLLAFSVVFYLFSGPKYLLYVAATALATYGAALGAHRTRKSFAERLPELRKTLPPEEVRKLVQKNDRRVHRFVALALAVDLGILIVLKYLDFVLSNINALLPEGSALPLFRFVLPLGLSFYTFSAVGYVVDVGRGKYEPERNFARFALYITYFPQVIQGPIPRYDRLAPQLAAGHAFDYENLRDGFQLILWGIFKKLVIADSVAAIVQAMLKNVDAISGLEVWLGMFVWGIQIYTDFSGGIDVTRGLSHMLGIELDINFRRPYFSTDLSDFWNRWHISLGSWLKDYFFYPVALSKRYARFSKFMRNKFGKFIAKTVPVGLLSLVLFTVIGIWHGANWGETLFGVFNGVVVLISTLCEPLLAKARKKLRMDGSVFWRVFRSVRTFLLITLARVLSLPLNMGKSGRMYAKMFGFSHEIGFFTVTHTLVPKGGLLPFLPAALGCVLLFTVSLTEERGHGIRELINRRPAALRVALAALGTAAIFLFGAYGLGYDAASFIYSNY